MSAFEKWWDTKTVDLGQRGGYIYKQEKAAWNAARRHERNATLDQLEGLAEEWKTDGVKVGPNHRSQTAAAAADKLLARIKELRT